MRELEAVSFFSSNQDHFGGILANLGFTLFAGNAMSIRYLAGLSLEGIVCFEGMQSYKGQKKCVVLDAVAFSTD